MYMSAWDGHLPLYGKVGSENAIGVSEQSPKILAGGVIWGRSYGNPVPCSPTRFRKLALVERGAGSISQRSRFSDLLPCNLPCAAAYAVFTDFIVLH